MKKSVFNLSNLSKLKENSKGVKASNDTRAEILTGRGLNKFTMNGMGSKLVGLQDRDNLVIFSMPDASSIDEKYFIAKAPEGKGVIVATNQHKEGEGLPVSFNYSGIWSEWLQNGTEGFDARAVGEAGLMAKGIVTRVATQKQKDTDKQLYSNLAKYRIGFEIEKVLDDKGEAVSIEIDGTTYEEIFILKSPIKYGKDGLRPFVEGEEEEEEVVAVEDETSDETVATEDESSDENEVL